MDNRAIVKQFIRERWSDQKIAEVFAFNQDGKMDAENGCCCIVGVHSSQNLHTRCGEVHYTPAKAADPKLHPVECAYLGLSDEQPAADRILGEILTEIMAEREALRELSPADVAAIQEVTHG